MSAREFGLHVFGDPGFVSSLKKGRSLNLDNADRVLQFMDEAPIGPKFRDEVEAFLSRTGMKPYKLGEDALGDNTFVRRLRSGVSPRLRTVDRCACGCATPNAPQARERSTKDPLTGDVPLPGRYGDVPLRTQGRGPAHALAPIAQSFSRGRYRTPVLPVGATPSFTRAKTSSNGCGRSAKAPTPEPRQAVYPWPCVPSPNNRSRSPRPLPPMLRCHTVRAALHGIGRDSAHAAPVEGNFTFGPLDDG